MKHIEIQYFKTTVGELLLGSVDGKLCLCDWHKRKKRKSIDDRIQKLINGTYIENNTEVMDLTRQQLNEYFACKRISFDLPILLLGTEFQKKVWHELMRIPYATTTSYLNLAKNINQPKAIRAIANANAANAISIIVPCHRVISNNGNLAGYAGGIETKKQLIQFETLTKKGNKCCPL
ncbi:MAG: methylated-DNA--[protein]-cysteine S-methyltransferase [Methylococcales bacterium]|nr:methylated-DNA--[protein]-cysteine S-methyltransferase [Methylococcales bacterium]